MDHQNAGNQAWLGHVSAEKKGVFEDVGVVTNPETRRPVRVSHAWSYEPSTQTCYSKTLWEELDSGGKVVDHWESGSIPLHCLFRFEMEHLLARTGFEAKALYGDFFRKELKDDSTEMVWIARHGPGNPQ